VSRFLWPTVHTHSCRESKTSDRA